MKVSPVARALTLALLLAACDAAPPAQNECVSSFIVEGLPATTYPEAVLLEMSQHGFLTGSCSGALIAPRVVLTAGHCVAAFTGFAVRAPFVDQSATASGGETFDWNDKSTDNVTSSQHDVGLVYLDTPITLTSYPTLAAAPVAGGGNIVNIGRIKDGAISSTMLYLSKPQGVSDGAHAGFPFDYVTGRVIELGDSGGPVEVQGATPHEIVAVNSGVRGGTEMLARVDLLGSWIQDRIASHGGSGPTDAPAPAAVQPSAALGCGAQP